MKTSLTWIIAGVSLSLSAFGADYKVELDKHLDDLIRVPFTTTANDSSPACKKRYEELYKDGYLNIAIGFGYWDNSPYEHVFDQYIANALRRTLTEPCNRGHNVCGFSRKGDFFTKIVRGPDGRPNRFTVSLTYGTLTTNNVANTTTLRERQYAQCNAATNKFFGEVARGSEVVMYIGHARDGGGPDFCPPVRKENKKTNYDWYQANRPGFKKLLSAMDQSKAAGRSNQIIGLYSCSSKRHFHNEMKAKLPEAGYILTSNEIMATQAINSIASTIDALAGKKCVSGFNQGLKLSGDHLGMYGMFTRR